MRASLSLVPIALLSAAACGADFEGHELTLQSDVRWVAIDSDLASFTQGGLGLLRFDDDQEGLRLGRALIDLAGPLSETVRYALTAIATDDGDQNIFDVTEAFIEWRPYPSSQWRWETKLGAFYAPISLENRGIGWQSPYSLSFSAINTWMGEESRTIGVETSLTSMGVHADRDFDLSVVASVYEWNDPFGVMIMQRGWGIHDRQSPLFGDLPRPLVRDPNIRTIEFFHEIDDRIGYYAGAELKWRDDGVVRVLHYDNLGDPDDRSSQEPAWHTKFESLGARWEFPGDLSVLAQGMLGTTEVGPQGNGRGMILLEYWSYYVLASKLIASHRFTARYDVMYTDAERGPPGFKNGQDAAAWTLAYLYDIDEHWQVAVEGLTLTGTLDQRTRLGLPARATEKQLQVAVRWTF